MRGNSVRMFGGERGFESSPQYVGYQIFGLHAGANAMQVTKNGCDLSR